MYRGMLALFGRYWQAYGGGRALVRSPYLHLSLVLLALTYPIWSAPHWWDAVINVLPNLLGFTLGGFAMFLGFGDEKFRALLAEADDDDPEAPSLYVGMCATFVHFILVQVLALLFALLAKAWWFPFPWPATVAAALPALNMTSGAAGFGLFLYAITSAVAATMHVFRMATWYEQHQRQDFSD